MVRGRKRGHFSLVFDDPNDGDRYGTAQRSSHLRYCMLQFCRMVAVTGNCRDFADLMMYNPLASPVAHAPFNFPLVRPRLMKNDTCGDVARRC